jgi:acyl carrier protein
MINKTYIQSYITIQNNEIVLNGTSVFKIESTDFGDFSKQAFRNFEIQYPKFFKMDALSKLAFLGSELLLSPIILTDKENNIALVLANKSSSLDTDVKYQESISDKENYFPSPAVFVYTLPNICLGEISIRHQLKSENSFFIFDVLNAEFLSKYSEILLNTNKADSVLCGWVEYFNDNYKAFLCLISKEENEKYRNENINTLYNKIMEALKEELKNKIITTLNLEDIAIEDIADNDPLFGDGLGLDSIDALELIVILDKDYGIKLVDPKEGKTIFQSIETMAAYISANRTK